jgi:AAA15 family ATPase/GTPase
MHLDGFGVAGYRSFNENIEYIGNCGKVNVIIGKNNSGKSNILRFIGKVADILNYNSPNFNKPTPALFSSLLDLHKGMSGNNIDFAIQIKKGSKDTGEIYSRLFEMFPAIESEMTHQQDNFYIHYKFTVSDKNPKDISFVTQPIESIISNIYDFRELDALTGKFCGYKGGDAKKKVLDLAKKFNIIGQYKFDVQCIDCYRKITAIDVNWMLNGSGLISKLNEMKEPVLGKEADRKKYDDINTFVKEILNKTDAFLDIPHTVDELYVNMDGRRLPISSLGTGIHQVIILAAAVTLLENTVVCIEEPEIYLHPELQKKFIEYITRNTDNQYFITTHSNAVFDCFDVNIYHCRLDNGKTACSLAATASQKYPILNDLGCKASDILQSNCIVWVEGPSDRIYINKWIAEKEPALREGLHYSIMFYGGRLLSHLSAADEEVNEFIKLIRINRNIAIIIDSDKTYPNKPINATKKRIKEEFSSVEGYCWITKGNEIENYISEEQLGQSIHSKYGADAIPVEYGQYETVTAYTRNGSKKSFDKVDMAKAITRNNTNYTILDLNVKVDGLIQFIKRANYITE